jgi:hypothetical protein
MVYMNIPAGNISTGYVQTAKVSTTNIRHLNFIHGRSFCGTYFRILLLTPVPDKIDGAGYLLIV